MSRIRNIKRPRFVTVLAALALCVALGGTATAASGLINGKNIKAGTITGKQIKNKSLNKAKFAPATLNALRGAQGPRGEQGPQGPKGAAGTPGVAGPKVVNSFSIDDSASNVPANTEQEVLSFNNLNSSKYLVIAKAIMVSNGAGAFHRCAVETNNSGGGDEAQWTAPAIGARNTVPMVLTTANKVTQIKVNCQAGSSIASFDVHVVAIPVG